MSDKEAVRDLLDRLPDDATLGAIREAIEQLHQPVAEPRDDLVVTKEGFVMLPFKITRDEVTRAIRADRDSK